MNRTSAFRHGPDIDYVIMYECSVTQVEAVTPRLAGRGAARAPDGNELSYDSCLRLLLREVVSEVVKKALAEPGPAPPVILRCAHLPMPGASAP